ncbi:MAG: hypothetical protein MJB57_06620, partial [Gemmatimonadetes bacterium]|nr:hypothetical protein [Gemmatimonadota bacterium]
MSGVRRGAEPRTRSGEASRREGASPSTDPGGRTWPDGFFATTTVRLPNLEPEAVLAAPPSGQRGFWQSGPRWIAHAGAAGEIDGREGTAAEIEADPFAWLRSRADRLFRGPWVTDLDGEARAPRLHGGFAFGARARMANSAETVAPTRASREPGFWEAFPIARFTLPAFEVEADERGARLTVTRWFPDGTGGDRAIDELRRRADRTRDQLAELERSGASPGPPPAATAIDESVDPETWRVGIERILEAITASEVEKVVLGRPLDVTLGEAPDS